MAARVTGAHCRRTRVCGAKRAATQPAAPASVHAAAAAANAAANAASNAAANAARPACVGAQHGERGEALAEGARVLDGELREDAWLGLGFAWGCGWGVGGARRVKVGARGWASTGWRECVCTVLHVERGVEQLVALHLAWRGLELGLGLGLG